jgi:endonuclease YncB( thermonuclease family)
MIDDLRIEFEKMKKLKKIIENNTLAFYIMSFRLPKFNIFKSTNSEKKEYYKQIDIMNDECDIKWEDTQEFTFPIVGGKVIKVYDADTITIASKLPYKESPLYRLHVRLNGIDTPEMKGKDVSDEEKEAAKTARDFVHKLVFNKYVKLENVQSEKYGRILADVYVGDVHVNDLLLRERYAVKYDGGTKKKPSSWLKYKITGSF